MMHKKQALALALIVALLGVLGTAFLLQRDEQQRRNDEPQAATPVAEQALHRTPEQQANGASNQTGSNEVGLAKQYEESDDLGALIDQLTPLAESGDPIAARLIVRALEECAAYSLRPEEHIEYLRETIAKREPAIQEQSLALLNRHEKRCSAFKTIGPITIDERKLWNERAALAGDLVSQLKQIKNPWLTDSPSTDISARTVIENAIRSRNPEAIAEASFFLGVAAERFGLGITETTGTALSGYAWELVACDLGLNCGPGGQLLQDYCLNSGLCGYNNLEGIFAGALLSPVDFQKVLRTRDLIAASLREDNYKLSP